MVPLCWPFINRVLPSAIKIAIFLFKRISSVFFHSSHKSVKAKPTTDPANKSSSRVPEHRCHLLTLAVVTYRFHFVPKMQLIAVYPCRLMAEREREWWRHTNLFVLWYASFVLTEWPFFCSIKHSTMLTAMLSILAHRSFFSWLILWSVVLCGANLSYKIFITPNGAHFQDFIVFFSVVVTQLLFWLVSSLTESFIDTFVIGVSVNFSAIHTQWIQAINPLEMWSLIYEHIRC